LVRLALDKRRTLAELSLDELQSEHAAFEADIYAALDPETAIERRCLPGGPARSMVQAELRDFRTRLNERQLDIDRVCERYGVRMEP
jgi:argininosuccinate lyase